MPNTLFLRLEGPLQSWGERGHWSVRDTAPEPTKSGVIGLLACALGHAADDQLVRLDRAIRFGVRCDAPGQVIMDYHTIGGGYSEPMLLTAEGKPKKSSGRPHTELSERFYLSDASFLVAVMAVPDLVAELVEAVQHPVWPIYLGRRSCPPSVPLYADIGEYVSLDAALAAGPWRPGQPLPGDSTTLRGVIECTPAEGVRRRDAILSRRHRRYGPRYTCDTAITLATGS